MGRNLALDASRPRGAAALTAFVDTNVLIRHLTGDPPAMARRATALLASAERLLLADLIVAECVFVLESFYEVERAQIAALMRAAIALPTVETVDPSSLLRVLEVYEVDRLDFAEAYLVAQAEATGIGEIASFDRTIDRIEGRNAARAVIASARGRGRLRCVGRCVVAVAAVLLAAGCGEAKRPVAVVSEKAHHADVARDPYALTCRDLARQPLNSVNQRLVINAEFALAKDPALRERVEAMTENRVGRSVYWALTEICKGRAGSYEPARAAVTAVRDGRYVVQPRPESWSRPELWSDPAIEKLGD